MNKSEPCQKANIVLVLNERSVHATEGDYRMRIAMSGPLRLYSFAVTKH